MVIKWFLNLSHFESDSEIRFNYTFTTNKSTQLVLKKVNSTQLPMLFYTKALIKNTSETLIRTCHFVLRFEIRVRIDSPTAR